MDPIQNPKSKIQNAGWVWHDPFGDSAWTAENDLVIHAPNGRNLEYINLSAPRLVRPVSGDFALQASCAPGAEGKPAIGGLLVWKDRKNYLRLEWGLRGHHDISFQGCIENADGIFGRGRLESSARCLPELQVGQRLHGLASRGVHPLREYPPPPSLERVILRLERRGMQVRALCRSEGEWFTAGQVLFPVEDPVEVGLHAIGHIDRLVYPGAYPEGTAIRFDAFELWH